MNERGYDEYLIFSILSKYCEFWLIGATKDSLVICLMIFSTSAWGLPIVNRGIWRVRSTLIIIIIIIIKKNDI